MNTEQKFNSSTSPAIVGNTMLQAVRVLNLYAGIGGNRKLWEGCEVTAVEYNQEIAEGLISEHQAHQIVYLIGEDDKSIMTTNEQRREIAIESAKISCLHIKRLTGIPQFQSVFWTRVQSYLNGL